MDGLYDENGFIICRYDVDRIKHMLDSEKEAVEFIIFPSYLKSIDDNLFYNFDRLHEVNLANTKITTIGECAFRNCQSLKEISFPNTLKEIGDSAFKDCENLEEVDLSNTQLETIEARTFSYCLSLNKIIFPNTLKTIKMMSFDSNQSLEEIDLYNTQINKIEKQAFLSCKNLEKVVLPNTIQKIDKTTFNICLVSLKVIILDVDKKDINLIKDIFKNCPILLNNLIIVVNDDSLKRLKVYCHKTFDN